MVIKGLTEKATQQQVPSILLFVLFHATPPCVGSYMCSLLERKGLIPLLWQPPRNPTSMGRLLKLHNIIEAKDRIHKMKDILHMTTSTEVGLFGSIVLSWNHKNNNVTCLKHRLAICHMLLMDT